MIHLYLNQGGMETDVTAQSEILCSADATLRLCSDPADGVIRVTVRTADFRINRNFSGSDVCSGVDLGPAMDYAAGLRLAIMYEGKPNDNLRFAIHTDAGSAPAPILTPVPHKPEPDPVRPVITPVIPVVPTPPAADPEELSLLKAQNADLQTQLAAVVGEVSSLRTRNAALEEELAALQAAAGASDEASRRIAELEQQLSDAVTAYGLKVDADGLTREIDRLRRELEQKKNQRFELEMDDLPAAQDALKKAEEALAQAESDLHQAQQKLAETEAAKADVQAALGKAAAALADLQARHTDVSRALTELQELRNQLGMQDAERIQAEQQLADAQSVLARLDADLAAALAAQADRQKQLDELAAAEEADAKKLADAIARQQALNAELRQLDKEIADLDYLQKNKAHEWEEKVRKLSAILADVLQTELDLRVTYSILTTARQDDYFKRLGEEAEAQWAVLEECSTRMTQVRDWVRNIKNMQAQEGN